MDRNWKTMENGMGYRQLTSEECRILNPIKTPYLHGDDPFNFLI